MRPPIQYAKSGDLHIAYQVLGEGPLDLVFVPPFLWHLEYCWEETATAQFLERLASFSRLVLFDKRGMGLSDRFDGVATLEERMDDVRAVMDAVGLERAALFGVSEGGPMSLLFAATYPERVQALALCAVFARTKWAPDYPWGYSSERVEEFAAGVKEHWGRDGFFAPLVAPGLRSDPNALEFWARFERNCASPGTALAMMRMSLEIDVRQVLPAIHVPTLVVHSADDPIVPIRGARHLAEQIPSARFVELPGEYHSVFHADLDVLLAEVQEFLTGTRAMREPDRVLATVLFTDIVDSTRHAAEFGDRRWREVLESHHRAVRRELVGFQGREVDTAGDGFFAVFDGPARAIRCATAIRQAVEPLGIEIRAGIHTGECERMGEKVGGIAVHIGARVASSAERGEVRVSSTVKDLVVGSGIEFTDRGHHTLKGVPGEWQLFRVATA